MLKRSSEDVSQILHLHLKKGIIILVCKMQLKKETSATIPWDQNVIKILSEKYRRETLLLFTGYQRN